MQLHKNTINKRPSRIEIMWVTILLILALTACSIFNIATITKPTPTLRSSLTSDVRPQVTQTELMGQPAAIQTLPSATIVESPATIQVSNTPVYTTMPVGSPIPLSAMIHASVATNCRSGPGPVYDVVGYLLVGVPSEVLGRLASNDWWNIRNPTRPGETCWVWRQTTRVEGDVPSLAILTPPPTPTSIGPVSFTLAFDDLYACATGDFAAFDVRNTGPLKFESAEISIQDLETAAWLSKPTSYPAPFKLDACGGGITSLGPAMSAVISVRLSSVKYGHHGRATVMLCTENGLNGTCVTHTVDFPLK